MSASSDKPSNEPLFAESYVRKYPGSSNIIMHDDDFADSPMVEIDHGGKSKKPWLDARGELRRMNALIESTIDGQLPNPSNDYLLDALPGVYYYPGSYIPLLDGDFADSNLKEEASNIKKDKWFWRGIRESLRSGLSGGRRSIKKKRRNNRKTRQKRRK